MASARWLRLNLAVSSPKGGSVSRSALCQARAKIKASLFTEIDEGLLERFYFGHGNDVELWKGLRLTAMDGSSLVTNQVIYQDFLKHLSKEELEDMKENHEYIYSEETQLHTVTLHDVLNDLCLGYTVDFKSVGERELVVKLSEILKPDMLLILDRGYPACWFFRLLKRIGVKFIIRLKNAHSKEVQQFFDSGKKEATMTVALTGDDAGKLKSAGFLSRIGSAVKVRLVRVEHDGAVRIFATSLKKKKASVKEIGELYLLRWNIETSYDTFKTYLKLEGWRINSKRGVLLDFAVKKLLYNLACIISLPAKELLRKEQSEREKRKPEGKYDFRMCRVYSIEGLKSEILPLICNSPSANIEAILKNYLIDLARNPSSVEKGRVIERKNGHKPNRRGLMNKKTDS